MIELVAWHQPETCAEYMKQKEWKDTPEMKNTMQKSTWADDVPLELKVLLCQYGK